MYKVLRFLRMFFNKPYCYFVAYHFADFEGINGVGNNIINCYDKIKSPEIITEIESNLAEHNNFKNVVIINYKRI